MNNKTFKNNLKIQLTLFFIKGLKLLGFGRSIFKKILFNILKIFIGKEKIFYKYNGKLFCLYPLLNSTDSKMIVSSRIIDKEELNYLKTLKKNENSVFIDIGANIGYYSISSSNFGFKKIYSFEPLPQTIEKLKFNIELNGLEKMIEVVPNALGLKKEFRDMYEDTNNFGNSSLIEGNDKSKLTNVQILNLYDFILEKGIKNIDAIKIDVEGFEDQALANFIDKSNQKELPKIIIIEHSNSYKWKIDLFNLFEMKNYKAILKTRGNTIFKKIE
jgi:FkbM family methyltransferase